MTRGHTDFINLEDLTDVPDTRPRLRGARRRVLSSDEETDAETVVLDVPDGWSADLDGWDGSLELLLLSGELETSAGALRREGWMRAPSASLVGTIRARGKSQMLFMPDPAGDPEGELQVLDTRNLPWQAGVRGGPGGIAVKPLYEGSTVSMIIANVPRYGSGPEFHECPEELFVIAGDVSGRRGMMTAGSYFWRPEYITHGPYWSEMGLLTFVRGHGNIHAHWIEDANATVEDNRAYAAQLSR